MDLSLPSQWIIEAEPWQWLALGTPGFLAAWWLYGRRGDIIERKSTGGGLSIAGRLGLSLIRWLAITLLAFLLLEPLIREIELEKEAPTAVILMDQSSSILARTDSGATEQELNEWFVKLNSELRSMDLQTEWYGFDQGLSDLASPEQDPIRWEGSQTNLSEAIEKLNDRIENRNIAGIILASDGLINRGIDPEYGASWPLTATYTVGLGDTTNHEDRWIERINHNQIAYLNNTFPVEAIIQSQGMEGQKAQVKILQGNEQLAKEEWTCSSDQDLHRVRFMLTATAVGTQSYRIQASIGNNEFDAQNNQRSFYVDVMESRRLVTCIASAPHPDIGAVTMALDALDAYEVRTIYLNGLSDASIVLKALETSDVIIAHNLLGRTWGGKEWESWVSSQNINAWWMATSSTSFNHLRKPNGLGVRLTNTTDVEQNFRARINPSFGIIDYEVGTIGEAMRSWPPMTGPMESLEWSKSWTPLLFKQLGNIETLDAFWATQIKSSGERAALTIGEGLWNWRMRNYLQSESHDTFNQLIQRHVQFLAASNLRERFKIQTESRVSSDSHVSFQAEAYDAGWAMSANAQIEVILQDTAGSEFIKDMRFDGERYRLDFGHMPEGQYTWNAKCSMAQETYRDRGVIVVENIRLEQSSLPANHALLKRISAKNGGTFIGDWQSIDPADASRAFVLSGVPPTILHEQVALQDGVEWIPILILALLLLAIEWVIRRRTVGY
jgi:hypothetical protein